VTRLDIPHRRWERRAFEQDVFFPRKSSEDTSRSFGVDVTGQSTFACSERCLLLRAIATPLHKELVGVSECARWPISACRRPTSASSVLVQRRCRTGTADVHRHATVNRKIDPAGVHIAKTGDCRVGLFHWDCRRVLDDRTSPFNVCVTKRTRQKLEPTEFGEVGFRQSGPRGGAELPQQRCPRRQDRWPTTAREAGRPAGAYLHWQSVARVEA
jgi:hypothetical protein